MRTEIGQESDGGSGGFLIAMPARFALWTAATSVVTLSLAGGVWLADRTFEGSPPTEPPEIVAGREEIRAAVESADCADLRRNIIRWRDALDGEGPGTPEHDIPALLVAEATDAHRDLECRSAAVDPPVYRSPGTGSTRIAYL